MLRIHQQSSALPKSMSWDTLLHQIRRAAIAEGHLSSLEQGSIRRNKITEEKLIVGSIDVAMALIFAAYVSSYGVTGESRGGRRQAAKPTDL